MAAGPGPLTRRADGLVEMDRPNLRLVSTAETGPKWKYPIFPKLHQRKPRVNPGNVPAIVPVKETNSTPRRRPCTLGKSAVIATHSKNAVARTQSIAAVLADRCQGLHSQGPVNLTKRRITCDKSGEIGVRGALPVWRSVGALILRGSGCSDSANRLAVVRAAGLEPALLAKTDFESVASTIPPRPHNPAAPGSDLRLAQIRSTAVPVPGRLGFPRSRVHKARFIRAL